MACRFEMCMSTFTAICGVLSDETEREREREKVLLMYVKPSQTRWAVM